MKIQIIVGSTRPGRVTDKVAQWVANEAKNNFDEVEILDLQEYKLPFFDELISPQYNPSREPTAEVKTWLDKLAEADAYVLVTPEYNRATSAVLKNALDHLDFQFTRKPIAIVGHGANGGAQAVANLENAIPQLKAVVSGVVYANMAATGSLDDKGNLSEEVASNPYGPQGALKVALADTKWYADALGAARAQG